MLRILHILDKIEMQNQDEAYAGKVNMRFTHNFSQLAIFKVSIKTQLHDYFFREDKSPAIWLTFSV